MIARWRVALRLAGRDLRLNRVRAVLTGILIFLPVLCAAVFSAVLIDESSGAELSWLIAVQLPIAVLVALLAAPAFVVSARARTDDLELLISAGGAPRDLWRVVLTQGALVAAGAIVSALLVAIPLSYLVMNVIDPLGEDQSLTLVATAGWPMLAVLAFTGSLLAAAVPAHLASRPRRDDPSLAVSGLLALIGGLLILWGVTLLVDANGGEPSIAWKTVVLVVGVLLMLPALVSIVSWAAGRLPLPLRLVTRDAERHRSRTVPAIAAVMAGMAAVTALGVGSLSDIQGRIRDTTYRMPVGATTVVVGDDARFGDVAERAQAAGVALVPLASPDRGSDYLWARRSTSEVFPPEVVVEVAVADAATLRGWGVSLTSAQQDALAAGQALAGADTEIVGGHVRLEHDDETRVEQVAAVPADLGLGSVPRGPEPQVAAVVISPETAARLNLAVTTYDALVTAGSSSSSAAELERTLGPGVYVEHQQVERHAYAVQWWLLVLIGLAVSSLATGTAVALARLDGRQDAETLSAVGARPSTSRATAALSALFIGLIGSAIGLGVGLLPGARAAVSFTTSSGDASIIAVPWSLLAVVGLGVPLAVAVVAAATSTDRRGTAR